MAFNFNQHENNKSIINKKHTLSNSHTNNANKYKTIILNSYRMNVANKDDCDNFNNKNNYNINTTNTNDYSYIRNHTNLRPNLNTTYDFNADEFNRDDANTFNDDDDDLADVAVDYINKNNDYKLDYNNYNYLNRNLNLNKNTNDTFKKFNYNLNYLKLDTFDRTIFRIQGKITL